MTYFDLCNSCIVFVVSIFVDVNVVLFVFWPVCCSSNKQKTNMHKRQEMSFLAVY